MNLLTQRNNTDDTDAAERIAAYKPVDIALAYANAGIEVFPCRAKEEITDRFDPETGEIIVKDEKSPYQDKGLYSSTKNIRNVGILFGERHPDALIGIPTGTKLGAWVLDLDRHGEHDGHLWLDEMEAKHGPLPETARARTANNGTHLFFRYVEGIRNKRDVGPGVDVRGESGYIIAPGSVMSDGRYYEWVNWDHAGLPPLADAPQWLLDLVVPKTIEQIRPQSNYTYEPGSKAAYVEAALRGEFDKVARTSQRRGEQLNASAFSLGTLVGAGVLPEQDVEPLLYEAAVICGVAQKDRERATRDRIRRGLKAGIANPRTIPESTHANDDTRPVDVAPLIASAKRKAAAPDEAANDNEPQAPKRARFELTWFDDVEEGAAKEMIIKGMLGAGEFTILSGLPGTGKSVIVTDAACHVAAGMDWHGRKVKQGLVVYVAAERKKLTERRMMAFRQRHKVEDVALLVVGGRLDLTKDLKDAKDLIAVIKSAEEQTGLRCVWVVIDTLTRVFGAGDQNASKDMTRFIQSCDEILAETAAHVMAVHHSAWSGERGKGAIDLDGAVDASFMVRKGAGRYQLICDGANDGEEGAILDFMMESVRIGVDADGEETTAPIVVPCVTSGKLQSGGPNSPVTHVLDALVRAQENGVEPEGHSFPDGILVVTEDEWRAEYYSAEIANGTKQNTASQRFGRCVKQLKERDEVRQVGQHFWAKQTEPATQSS